MLLSRVSTIISLSLPAFGYIPASPTNSTLEAIAGGLNVTDVSNLHLQWFSNGSYSMHVSYQLAGFGSTGISKGVLVHFSEEKVSNFTPPTSTPWIALVSCDQNATEASMDEDIFTLARDKGAVSAMLYSLYSVACVINPQYSDPATFDQVFDIFSSQSATSSHVIEYQFGQLTTSRNQSILAYNSEQLNHSGNDIEMSINTGSPSSAGYLLAVLQAYNATDNTTTPTGGTGNPNTHTAGSKPPNTALAMIILYAITGCVSALFCIVIISGAIRAIRHPERYGPRARMGDNGSPPQSRARGLTRAILDTFPIVKFGSNSNASGQDISTTQDKDDRRRDPAYSVELGNLSPTNEELLAKSHPIVSAVAFSASGSGGRLSTEDSQTKGKTERPTSLHSQGSGSRSHPPSSGPSEIPVFDPRQSTDTNEGPSRVVSRPPNIAGAPESNDVVLESIGRETCPICIVDFEEGDDIRVLPCEGKHCFHQACVDPWLLKLSSSCPICRHDFLALENMLSGQPHDEDEDEQQVTPITHRQTPLNPSRFSRYLRFAYRRHRRGDEPDPTDPYMPTAPETPTYSGHEA